MRLWGIFALSMGLSVLSARTSAHAGAWNRVDQDSLLIFNSVLSCFSCEDEARRIDRRAYSIYGEYGWSDHITLMGELSWQRADGPQAQYSKVVHPSYTNLTASQVGLQWQALRQGRWVGAIAGQVALGGPDQGQDPFAPGEPAGSYGVKAMLGYGFGEGRYLEGEVELRQSEDQVLRWAVTYGQALTEYWDVRLQSFSAVSMKRHAIGLPDYQSHQFQASLQRQLTRDRFIEFGITYAPATSHTLEERGLRIGVWRAF